MNESVILDHTGKPFKNAPKTLATHQTRATLTGVRSAWQMQSVANGLTPARLAAVLQGASQGSIEDYLILAEEMEERDSHYASVLRTRKLAVAGLEAEVESASDEAHDIQLADAVRDDILANPRFDEMLIDLLDGIGKGFGVVEAIWRTQTTPWVPDRFEWVDPRWFQFDQETGRELRHADGTVDGKPLDPYKYIVHMPRMKSGLPIRNGLARLVAVMYMLKGFTLKDWWAFAEVFGMPIRVGKYGRNATEDEIDTLVSAIANIASDAGAVIPESMQVEFIEAAKSAGGDSLFENMADWADRQISKAVLGQTMTSDDGSSMAQAQVHNEVRGDILRFDAKQLANTLNETVVRWYIDLNYGPQKRYPKITLPVLEPEDVDAWTSAVDRMVRLGLKVEQSVVRDKLGIPDPETDAELLVSPELQRPAAEPTDQPPATVDQANNQQTALNRQQPAAQAALDELEQELLDEWQPVMKPLVDPLTALADTADSFEAFMAGLPGLLNEMDESELVKRLAASAFKARGMGDAQ